MNKKVEVSLLGPDEWERLRAIRIRALIENPEAFGANLAEVNAQSKEVWLKLFEKEDYLIASISGVDVGMLYIEVLKGDHGATCWIGGFGGGGGLLDDDEAGNSSFLGGDLN